MKTERVSFLNVWVVKGFEMVQSINAKFIWKHFRSARLSIYCPSL